MFAKFSLGALFVTPAVREKIPTVTIRELFGRHAAGDFGDLCEEDHASNVAAIERGGDRIHSAYEHQDRTVYVVTDRDRTATTVMFAYEYQERSYLSVSSSSGAQGGAALDRHVGSDSAVGAQL